MSARRVNTMRVALPLLVVASTIAVAAAQTPSPSPQTAAPPAGVPPAAGPPAAGPSGAPPAWAADNERYLAELQKAIAGKEDKPAKEVFKNLKILGDAPAGRIPRTMQAFTRSL